MRDRILSSVAIFAATLCMTKLSNAQPVEPSPPPGVVPPPAPPPPPPPAEPPHKPGEADVLGKWAPKLYGFVQLIAIEDTTQSFGAQAGNALIARPDTYQGEHSRFTMAGVHSRLGLKFATPGDGDVKVTAQAEVDFLGAFAPNTSEATLLANPVLRLRHFYFKLENPFVDLLMGQTWALFGWQGYFHPTTVEIQGVPGEVYLRQPQIRLQKTLKGDTANFDIGVAAARPPQRDSALPDLQGGLKLTLNNWKGVRTSGATGTQADAMAIGVSAALRWFKVADFAARPTHKVTGTGWGLSADAFVPIIPGTMERRGNSLTLTGSFVTGAGINDFYSGLTGGITFPPLPNPMGLMPAPVYVPDIDNGLVAFKSNGELEAIKWWSTIVGLQYYLPPSGNVFIAANYSHLHSSNIVSLGVPGSVFDTSNWFDVALFVDLATAVRLGFEYQWFEQTYGDDVKAHNSRFNLAGFFLF